MEGAGPDIAHHHPTSPVYTPPDAPGYDAVPAYAAPGAPEYQAVAWR